MNMDLDHVESLVTEKTKAIVPVHYGGLCNDMDRLNKIASKYNIPIIQDAAHSIGTTYKGKQLAELSDYVMYSFQAIKHFTTGDGGMLLVDKELQDKAKELGGLVLTEKLNKVGFGKMILRRLGINIK